MTAAERPIDYDPFDDFNRAMGAGTVMDPWPDLHEQRREPIKPLELDWAVLNPGGEAGPPVFTVSTFRAVQLVLRDSETFSSAGYSEVMGKVFGHSILEMDEPEHHLYRGLIQQAFTRPAMEYWENALMRPLADRLIDDFVDDGVTDLVRRLTFPFPFEVIADLIGLPSDQRPRFHQLATEVISVTVDMDRAIRASVELGEVYGRLLEERRTKNDPDAADLVSLLARAELEDTRLEDEDIFAFLRLLLSAGAETTYRSSSNLLFGLLTHPDQLRAVRDDREALPRAIEEGLRWEPPLHPILRTAVTDTEVLGTAIPAGSVMMVNLGSANHDETRWDDPEAFDIFRDARPHLAFAHGPHTCLGMHLARRETTVLIESILDRLPDVRLDPDAPPPYITGNEFRCPPRLDVVWSV